MATWTSQRSGNWSRTSDNADSPWHDGGAQTALAAIPAAGDAVVIATSHVVAMDVARIPATGSLATLTFQGTGQVTADMTAAIFDTPGASINVTGAIVIGALAAGSIEMSGAAAATDTLTVNAGSMTGGATNGGSVVQNSSTGKMVVNLGTGTATGSSGSTRNAIVNASTGTFEFTGNLTGAAGPALRNASTGSGTINNCTLTGGSGSLGPAFINSSSASVTLNNCNLVDSANCSAWHGKPPIWTVTNKVNYHQVPTVNADGRGSQVMRFYLAPTAAQVLSGVAGGFEDGANPPGYSASGTMQKPRIIGDGGLIG